MTTRRQWRSVGGGGIAWLRDWLATITRPMRRKYGLVKIPPDRALLEQMIFPQLCRMPEMETIVFVGCDTYTEHYEDFFASRSFITLDRDPDKSRYGARHHVVDSVTRLQSHFSAESIDGVICNGVIGWGLDDPEEVERAAQAMFSCLREGGILVLGWDDIPERRPVGLEESFDNAGFAPLVLEPFPSPVHQTFTELRHVYNFYKKPPSRVREH